MAGKAGRPKGRREYVEFEVYVKPDYEAVLEEAKARATRENLSLSLYVCMALRYFNAYMARKAKKGEGRG